MGEAKNPRAVTLDEILEKFAGQSKLKRLNLGAGDYPQDGWTNVDIHPLPGVQVVCDLFDPPWPFEDQSVDLVYMCHFLEHVPDWMKFWHEMDRICAPGARVVCRSPYWSSIRAGQDPTHKVMVSEMSFAYLNREWREKNQITHYLPHVNFVSEYDPWYAWDDDFLTKSDEARAYARQHYINAVHEIVAFLKKEP